MKQFFSGILIFVLSGMGSFSSLQAQNNDLTTTLSKKDPQEAINFLTDYSVNTGNNTVMEWQKLYYYLFTKYMDGNIKRPKALPAGYKYTTPYLNQPGYGEDWYRKIVKETGDKFKVIDTHKK